MLLVLPTIGYALFDERLVDQGMVTLGVGTTLAILLPVLDILPYAPFLAEPPFSHGRLQPAWILSTGRPSIFATGFGLVVFRQLLRRLRERQVELERLSSTDVLTGLANRAAYLARLDEEVERARRYQVPLCILAVDIDHFKAINDTHGHRAGDTALRELGGKLTASLRAGDLAGRLGGDELAVILPHTSLGDARHAADTLVARADAALYAAKRAGPDRVSVSE